MIPPRRVTFIGAPFDLGAADRGCRLGPAAFRLAEVYERVREAGYEVDDVGDVPVPSCSAEPGDPRMKYLQAVQSVCEAVRDRVAAALREGCLPVVLGGDHSLSMGTIAGTSHFHRERGEKIGLLWFDAHDDMNTPETSPNGNLHGMPLAAAVGMGEPGLVGLAGSQPMVEGPCVAALGLRVIGAPQRENIRRSRIGLSTRNHFDEQGIRAVMENAIRRACNGTAGFHVSLDLDVLDPELAPGVGSPSAGGLSLTQARLALEMLAATGRLLSVDLVELNPALDRQNVTARIGVSLLASLLTGRRS